MADAETKIDKIVDRIHQKTLSGQLKWDDSFSNQTYQVRFGDFVFQIDGSMSSLVGVNLTIKKLNGNVVAVVGPNRPNLFQASNSYEVSELTRAKVGEIFTFLDRKDGDLDDLLNILG
jgi:hypothetical protein